MRELLFTLFIAHADFLCATNPVILDRLCGMALNEINYSVTITIQFCHTATK